MSVESGVYTLKSTVCWPVPLLDMNVLHSKWLSPRDEKALSFPKYHPQFLALENCVDSVIVRMT